MRQAPVSWLKASLRSALPQGYDWLVKLRGKPLVRWIDGASTRSQFRLAIQDSRPLVVDIAGQMGFGGVLSNVVKIQLAAATAEKPVKIISLNSLYAPPGVDMIGRYFERSHAINIENAISISLRHDQDLPTPLGRNITLQQAYEVFTSNYQPLPKFNDAAEEFISNCGRALGVHYRGSDKRLEATTGSMSDFYNSIDTFLDGENFDTIVVATDEPAFLENAKSRYGARLRNLECQYMANGLNPAHFADGNCDIKGAEAFTTMLALSKCDTCVRSPSLLSAWAKIIRPSLKTLTLGKMLPGQDHFPEHEIALKGIQPRNTL